MAEESNRGARTRSGSRLLIFVLLSLVAIGAAVWFWRSSVSSSAAEAAKPRATLHLETFVLNLAGPDERAYLRAGVDLGLRSAPGKDANTGPAIPLIRDTILGVLSTARPEDILTPQGKQALKTNILRALRERVPDLEVEDVDFTEFLVQR